MQEIHFYAFETWCRIWIEEGSRARDILNTCRAMALQTEKMLNMYDKTSELSLLSQNYQPGECQKVSPELFSFFKVNLHMARLSDGKFDFTVGPLVKRWNFGSRVANPPDTEEISRLLPSIGYQHIHLEGKDGVVFDQPGMLLDPGGSGKGFALDRIVGVLRERGVKRACLDFGGNLYVMGDEVWEVGICHPRQPGQVIGRVEAKNQAVSTSACYEHAIERDGKVYGHILNPVCGKPSSSGFSSVTILTSWAVYADMLSTAIYLAGEIEGQRLLKKVREGLGIEVRCVMVPD